jgi:hypothetical protein
MPSFESIVKGLCRIPNPMAKRVFGGSKRLAWEAFCDYAHGGPRQLERLVSAEGIGPAHPDHELPGLLKLVDFIGEASHIGIVDGTSDRPAPPDALIEKLALATVIIERSTAS